MFSNIFANKRVLITGHTGFKGSWLAVWLIKLGAEVIGISKNVPTNPSMFTALSLEDKTRHFFGDICDYCTLKNLIDETKPDFIFHLAAQALVSVAHMDPVDTIKTNAVGTLNLLEVLRETKHRSTSIFITSDKSYDNIGQVWGYQEEDHIGGKDVYSGSKAAAEALIKSYAKSYFDDSACNVRLAVARAGNVIGGGDWAIDRIVPDAIQSWASGQPVSIRNPGATRPWQHALEPLSGYLCLASKIYTDSLPAGEPFNFGPKADQNRSVQQLINQLAKQSIEGADQLGHIAAPLLAAPEAKLLKLNCDKALHYLNWMPTMTFEETLSLTGDWYRDYFKSDVDMYQVTVNQINQYTELAAERQICWTE